ncbi:MULTISPECIES: hypothetical protein [unclassified Variovorax]|nr:MULTISPECIES: hypothetical protein [unclassified Variovorax]PNG48904.1 hypothetical protein CHC06_06672 [Variovorax sp. B2]PNG49411.1 hypothetical protein CHC07_06320 [Variovorax sp. B4]VTV18282.1 hypothetical protein WDL1P2_00004 [Variovorax sp. WDL1]
MMHRHQAPTESSLKKWSAAGEFDACVAADQAAAAALAPEPRAFTREEMLRRGKRAGRPGLRLNTRSAISRVYELWPHLADTGSQALLDLAVARVAEGLQSRLAQIAPAGHPPSPATAPAPAAPVVRAVDPTPTAELTLQELDRKMTAMFKELVEVKRELVQFAALRNNLITKLDDAVARTQEAMAATGSRVSGGPDPLVEARRDRDIGVVKSMLTEILEALCKK